MSDEPVTLEKIRAQMKSLLEIYGPPPTTFDSVILMQERIKQELAGAFGIPRELLPVSEEIKRQREWAKQNSFIHTPIYTTGYLSTCHYPKMPQRKGRTRKGWKIAHKYALNERRRLKTVERDLAYRMRRAVMRLESDMFRRSMNLPIQGV